jgi:hypothetical protein
MPGPRASHRACRRTPMPVILRCDPDHPASSVSHTQSALPFTLDALARSAPRHAHVLAGDPPPRRAATIVARAAADNPEARKDPRRTTHGV